MRGIVILICFAISVVGTHAAAEAIDYSTDLYAAAEAIDYSTGLYAAAEAIDYSTGLYAAAEASDYSTGLYAGTKEHVVIVDYSRTAFLDRETSRYRIPIIIDNVIAFASGRIRHSLLCITIPVEREPHFRDEDVLSGYISSAQAASLLRDPLPLTGMEIAFTADYGAERLQVLPFASTGVLSPTLRELPLLRATLSDERCGFITHVSSRGPARGGGRYANVRIAFSRTGTHAHLGPHLSLPFRFTASPSRAILEYRVMTGDARQPFPFKHHERVGIFMEIGGSLRFIQGTAIVNRIQTIRLICIGVDLSTLRPTFEDSFLTHFLREKDTDEITSIKRASHQKVQIGGIDVHTVERIPQIHFTHTERRHSYAAAQAEVDRLEALRAASVAKQRAPHSHGEHDRRASSSSSVPPHMRQPRRGAAAPMRGSHSHGSTMRSMHQPATGSVPPHMRQPRRGAAVTTRGSHSRGSTMRSMHQPATGSVPPHMRQPRRGAAAPMRGSHSHGSTMRSMHQLATGSVPPHMRQPRRGAAAPMRGSHSHGSTMRSMHQPATGSVPPHMRQPRRGAAAPMRGSHSHGSTMRSMHQLATGSVPPHMRQPRRGAAAPMRGSHSHGSTMRSMHQPATGSVPPHMRQPRRGAAAPMRGSHSHGSTMRSMHQPATGSVPPHMRNSHRGAAAPMRGSHSHGSTMRSMHQLATGSVPPHMRQPRRGAAAPMRGSHSHGSTMRSMHQPATGSVPPHMRNSHRGAAVTTRGSHSRGSTMRLAKAMGVEPPLPPHTSKPARRAMRRQPRPRHHLDRKPRPT